MLLLWDAEPVGKLQLDQKTPIFVPVPRGAVLPYRQAAEKIPAEPDQDNACAGKVISSIVISVLSFAALRLVIIENQIIQL